MVEGGPTTVSKETYYSVKRDLYVEGRTALAPKDNMFRNGLVREGLGFRFGGFRF
jgi:hypothetical protein